MDEQRTISHFIEYQTKLIDALIEEQQRLIELLKEKRQAVISHAVTKGLDRDVPMKDSGVEWLGKIPAHWSCTSFRRFIVGVEQGWSPDCYSEPADEHEWGVLKAGAVNNGIFRDSENKKLPTELSVKRELEVHDGDLIICRASGSADLIGSAAQAIAPREGLLLSDKLYRLRLTDNSDRGFFSLLLQSGPLRRQIEISIRGAEPWVST